MGDTAELRTDREQGRIIISGSLTKESVPSLFERLRREGMPGEISEVDLNGLNRLDTSGVALLEWLRDSLGGDLPRRLSFSYQEAPAETAKLIEEFLNPAPEEETPPELPPALFERLGGRVLESLGEAGRLAVLTAEVFFWSAVGVVRTAQRRKHSVLEQCWNIGVQSLPLVALLSVILGVILSLQSAIQLRTFGANIYVANLMSISMVNEMGPMMTAILLAGRSGSAIASEVATMKVSEEIEALEVMGIDPIRYVVVPKFLAMTLSIPILVAFSIYLGIGGGIVVGATALDIAPEIFVSRAANAVGVTNIVRSLTKSVFFGWVIVVIGSYYGFSVSGGAEEVGRATTMAVVYSIITVIVLDALFSLTSLV